MSQQMSLAHLYSQMVPATQTSNGLMTAADKAKLDTMSGNYLSLSGGTVNGNLTIASGSIITADTFKGNLQGNADTATTVNWSGILSKPNTLTGYGITDAVNASQVVTSPAANKILALDSNGNLPASITGNAATATTASTANNVNWINVSNKPSSISGYGISDAVNTSELVNVPAAGKVLRLDSNGKLPTDITGNAATATVATSANSVAFNNVTGKPSTLSGYGISDAVNNSQLSTVAAAGKVLVMDANGKLPTDITGNAATATQATLATSANAAPWAGITGKPTTVSGYGITDAIVSTDVVATATANKILKLDASGKLPTDITGNAATATTATAAPWTGITGKPTTVSGYGITDGITTADVVTTAAANKILKLDASGKLPTDITGNATTATAVAWTGITSKPTTVAGYGITDAALSTHNHNGVYANATHTHAATDVTQTATARFVTDAEKTTWNGKQNALGYTAENTANKGVANGYAGLGADGKIPLSQIPDTARQQTYVVATVAARDALTGLISGEQCYVTGTGDSYIYNGTAWVMMADADWANVSLDWTNVTGKPTTITGYGITDAYTITQVDSIAAGKAAVAHTHGDADITALAFSKLTGKPTTLSGYGITDGVLNTDVVTTATANKILKLDASGNLPTSITGNAATATTANAVAWSGVTSKPTTLSGYGITDAALSTHNHTGVYAPVAHTHSDAEIADVAWGKITSKPTTLSGYGITDGVLNTDVVTTAAANKILKLNASSQLPASITGNAATATKLAAARTISLTGDATGSASFDGSANVSITATVSKAASADAVAWTGVTGKPTTLLGYGITDAALSTHNHNTLYAALSHSHVDGDLVGIAWSKVTGKPTTVAGYGITDALTTAGGTATAKISVTTSAAGGMFYARQSGSTYSDTTNAAIIADTDNSIGTANYLYEGRLAGVRKFSVRADGRIDATDVYVNGTQVSLSTHDHASIIGNAATATKLAAARTITLSGNVTGSASFDGSANATITATVAAAPWSAITSKPTTLAGYGITDASLSSHTHANDASIGGPYSLSTHTHSGYLATTGGTISGNLTVTGTITGTINGTMNNIPTSDVGGNIWVATAAGTEGITSNVVFGVATAPASPQANQIWFDSANRVVKMFDGATWVTFGAAYN